MGRKHWRIQGRRRRAPQQDPILSFLHMFSPKSTHIRGRSPPTGNPGSTTGKAKKPRGKAVKSVMDDSSQTQQSKNGSCSSQRTKTNDKDGNESEEGPPPPKRGRGRPSNASSQEDSGPNTRSNSRRRLEFEDDQPDDKDIQEDATFFKIRVDKDEDNFLPVMKKVTLSRKITITERGMSKVKTRKRFTAGRKKWSSAFYL